MKKRLISVFLVFAIIFSLLQGAAFASVKSSAGNTDDENSEIFSRLSALTGGTSDEAYALLKSLGLLDENGNLDVNRSIDLDGSSMTLDEVLALLEKQDTDLGRIASVDGVPIALGDLKTIIQIEAELARIEEIYFSDRVFTEEQLVSLDSLMSQIEGEGISATLLGVGDSACPVITIKPVTSTGATASGYKYHDSSTEIWTGWKYELTLSGDLQPGRVYSFSWKTVRGHLPASLMNATLTWGSHTSTGEGDITFGDGANGSSPAMKITESTRTGTLTLSGRLSMDTRTELGYMLSGSVRAFFEF